MLPKEGTKMIKRHGNYDFGIIPLKYQLLRTLTFEYASQNTTSYSKN